MSILASLWYLYKKQCHYFRQLYYVCFSFAHFGV